MVASFWGTEANSDLLGTKVGDCKWILLQSVTPAWLSVFIEGLGKKQFLSRQSLWFQNWLALDIFVCVGCKIPAMSIFRDNFSTFIHGYITVFHWQFNFHKCFWEISFKEHNYATENRVFFVGKTADNPTTLLKVLHQQGDASFLNIPVIGILKRWVFAIGIYIKKRTKHRFCPLGIICSTNVIIHGLQEDVIHPTADSS